MEFNLHECVLNMNDVLHTEEILFTHRIPTEGTQSGLLPSANTTKLKCLQNFDIQGGFSHFWKMRCQEYFNMNLECIPSGYKYIGVLSILTIICSV
ncbi:unnamed protein product [Allacma fusca]|uniref:Uncharacterized protein n=1 Tax=Allacma fusca TaxID=39272 RepID=A0A8J2PJ76_9HEXA|nr:unnamed protein product [Allacma fusca]